MEIKKIEKLKNGKYKIHFLDATTLTTYDNILLEDNLLYHKRISNEEYQELVRKTNQYDIKYKIMKMISKRNRSIKEIKDYLLENQMTNSEEILSYFIDNHYLDDERFASAYINDRLLLSNDGPNQMIEFLRKHEIDEHLIYSKMEMIDDQIWKERIQKLIEKKKKDSISIQAQKQKIILDLVTKGYPREWIEEELSKVTFSSSGIQKEFDKWKSKLEKKYDGRELYYQIKNKLYQKGYTSEEMAEILETL